MWCHLISLSDALVADIGMLLRLRLLRVTQLALLSFCKENIVKENFLAFVSLSNE